MGFDDESALSALRFSTGWGTTETEVSALVEAVQALA
jgi:cysteine sulfinate desulfinase/cysteine desulfurase-like protein